MKTLLTGRKFIANWLLNVSKRYGERCGPEQSIKLSELSEACEATVPEKRERLESELNFCTLSDLDFPMFSFQNDAIIAISQPGRQSDRPPVEDTSSSSAARWVPITNPIPAPFPASARREVPYKTNFVALAHLLRTGPGLNKFFIKFPDQKLGQRGRVLALMQHGNARTELWNLPKALSISAQKMQSGKQKGK